MSVGVWIQAARPKTLFVSVSPVIVGISLVISRVGFDFAILPAIISLLFAVMAQIISNFVNDYADFRKGADDESRLGPKRMLASGLISVKSMKRALVIISFLTAFLGLSLIYWGGWVLLPIGLLIFIGAYSYSTGPFPLSYHGLGDVAVILFYGVVPVVFTYFILCQRIDFDSILAGFAMGFVADELLIVNNYRDVEQDKLHGKKTTAVLFGERALCTFFLFNPIIAFLLGFLFVKSSTLWIILGSLFLFYTTFLWSRLKKKEGVALNKILGLASISSFLFSIMVLLCSGVFF